jgi:hypothetical protein
MLSPQSVNNDSPSIDGIYSPHGTATVAVNMGALLLSLPTAIVRISRSGILLRADRSTLETMACSSTDCTEWLQTARLCRLLIECQGQNFSHTISGEFVWSDAAAAGLEMGFQFQEDDSNVANLLSSLA